MPKLEYSAQDAAPVVLYAKTTDSNATAYPIFIDGFGGLARYKCSDMDVTSDPSYFGFVDADGAWIIMRLNDSLGTIRYYKGDSAYTTNWTNRASLSYDYYYNIF